jgi:hypothetical protein
MIHKSIKFIFFIIFILKTLPSCGNAADTILNAVYSKPYFYNVLKNNKGEVYAGTSEGIFKLDGTELIRYSKQDGYITLDKDGLPSYNPDGIKNYIERKYLHLLPYPELARDEYHADSPEYFYLCSGGRMYIFDLTPYNYSYANHSIRTISENFVGTYSGIYLRGKLQGYPIYKFTDGYIREIDGRAFICYDGLSIIEPSAVQSGTIENKSDIFYLVEAPTKISYRDAFKSKPYGKYYYAATTELFQLDHPRAKPISIYKKTKSKEGDISILGEARSSLYFSDGNLVLGYQTYYGVTDTVTRLPEPVMDGKVNDRHLYALTGSGLYDVSTDKSVEKLMELSKAHTMEMISGSEMVISTDNGLFRFNVVNKSLSKLISGVEFNRKALFKKNNLLYAGSVNGLYTIDINDLELLVRKNQSRISESKLPDYVKITLISAGVIILSLVIMLLRNKRNLSSAEDRIKELKVDILDREKIENFIRENLAIASLKSIADYFQTNNSHIYKLIEPEKPGSIIQKLRHTKVIQMRKAGSGITEISRITGLSESYIRKIKAEN